MLLPKLPQKSTSIAPNVKLVRHFGPCLASHLRALV